MTRSRFKELCRMYFPNCEFIEVDNVCSVLGPTLLSTILSIWFNKNDEVVKMTFDYPNRSYKVKITEKNVIKKINWNLGK